MVTASPPDFALYPLSAETVRALHQDTVDENLGSVGRYVIHRRRIPDYYLRQELRDEGLDKTESDKMIPTRWVTEQGRITITDADIKLLALIVFLKINRRLMHHPVDETYQQARLRLRGTLAELLEKRLPRNVLAERLEISGKTVNSLIRYNPNRNGPIKHCPWQLLDKIDAVDWTAVAKVRQQPPPATRHAITEGEIQRQRRRQTQAMEKGLYQQRQYIRPGSGCPHCQSPWTMLRKAQDQDSLPDVEMTCLGCGRNCYLKAIPVPAPAPAGNRPMEAKR